MLGKHIDVDKLVWLERKYRQAVSQLGPGESLMAFLDDLYVLLPKPARARTAMDLVTGNVEAHIGIAVGGPPLPGVADLGPQAWRGKRPFVALGTRIGTPEYVRPAHVQGLCGRPPAARRRRARSTSDGPMLFAQGPSCRVGRGVRGGRPGAEPASPRPRATAGWAGSLDDELPRGHVCPPFRL